MLIRSEAHETVMPQSKSVILVSPKETTSKREMGWHGIFLNWHHFSLVAIYLWFGSLKLVGLSPARHLIEQTLPLVPHQVLPLLFGIWEVLIGLALLHPRFAKGAVLVLFFHLAATTLPLFLVPELCFDFPLAPNLTGQYIIKNLALFGAALETRKALNHRSRPKPQRSHS